MHAHARPSPARLPEARSRPLRRPSRASLAAGSTLLEVLVALALLVTIAAGSAHLLIWVRRAVWSAGMGTIAVELAAEKLEQLRSLTLDLELPAAVPRTDTTTDLSTHPPSAGGRGLAPSPPGTLETNVRGYFEYLDARGRWVGTGEPPPASARFVRRWAIADLEGGAGESRIFHVAVTPVAAGATSAAGLPPPHARLTTIRTRSLP